MNSIGERLKASREERGWSIDQVARETNISRQYIQALENDDYDAFPAEPYLLGFLRNYCDHLGLETEELISKYKAFKIQEQPAPMNALLDKPNPWPVRILLGAVFTAALVLILVFLVPAVADLISRIPAPGPSVSSGPAEYSMSAADGSLQKRLFKGDAVHVSLDGQNYDFKLKEWGPELLLEAPAGDLKLQLGEEIFVDLDGNTSMDLRVALLDLIPADPTRGAELVLERVIKPKDLAEGAALPLGEEVRPARAPQTVESGAASTPAREKKAFYIVQNSEIKPFTVDVIFRGYSLLRYVVDDRIREEIYFHKGETARIEASRKIALWVSNAGAFTGKVLGADLEIGKPGEVAAVTMEWVADAATGKMALRASPMY